MPYYVSDVNPDYTAALGLFQHLNTEELQKLLNDDSRVEAWSKTCNRSTVESVAQVKNAESEREMLLASNKSLADFNLSREPKMRQSRQQIKELYEQAQELMQEVEQRKKTLENSVELLEGETTVESFLEQFADARKLAHLRRVKVDKMTELLTNRSRNPSRLPGGALPPLPSRPAPPAPAPMPAYPPAGRPLTRGPLCDAHALAVALFVFVCHYEAGLC
ncbi:hypothetical protein HPB47_004948 [Ixodes persulcatus]|uniref:Uncharacterized protein n=1 Tax=Ixodes persulcatus TaxID=34615 RepID=A0AC60PFL1_IXOPE|nr:hypothetical protein HPB47_004948 [Ixodes persulcatus]